MKSLKFAISALVVVLAFAFTIPSISFNKKTRSDFYYLQNGVWHGVSTIQAAKTATGCDDVIVTTQCAKVYEKARLTFDAFDNVTGIAEDGSGIEFPPNDILYNVS